MPVHYFPGPIGIHGVAQRTPAPPAPARAVQAKPAAPKPEKKEEAKPAPKPEKKEEAKTKAKISRAPPPLKEGVSYMFPLEHTTIHIFQKPAPIWMEKYHHAQL